jgi:hypothetical protein
MPTLTIRALLSAVLLYAVVAAAAEVPTAAPGTPATADDSPRRIRQQYRMNLGGQSGYYTDWQALGVPSFAAVETTASVKDRLAALQEMPDGFAASQLRRRFPDVRAERIKRVLDQLRREARLRTEGRGPATRWYRC